MTTRKLKCSSCGANLDYNEEKQVIFCPYCGSKELVIEDDTRHIIANTFLKAKDKDNKHEEEMEKIKADNELKQQKQKDKSSLLYTIIMSILVIVLCILMYNIIKL